MSYDRQFSFRVHRFVCQGDMASVFNRVLCSPYTAQGAAVAPGSAAAVGHVGIGAGDRVLASNVGGFHSKRDLFKDPSTVEFQTFLSVCVDSIEKNDQDWRGDAEEKGVAASSKLREPTEAWINISTSNNLNLLHDHCDSTWSGVYYVDDGRGDHQGYLGGQLLLRLSPVGGTAGGVPHEDLHVPRMHLKGVYPDKAAQERAYAEVHPVPGTLIVFPGWLAHSVCPHLGNGRRVSVSFNVFLDDTGSMRCETSELVHA